MGNHLLWHFGILCNFQIGHKKVNLRYLSADCFVDQILACDRLLKLDIHVKLSSQSRFLNLVLTTMSIPKSLIEIYRDLAKLLIISQSR